MKFNSFLYSLKMAISGLRTALCREKNFQIQAIIMIFVLLLSFLLSLSIFEWCIILFCIGMVLCVELMNTSIEYLANLYNSHYDLRIKRIKDIVAGNVLVISLISGIIGGLILIPKCLNFTKSWKVILY